jgi:polysaccharide export outer membrane protein
MKNFAVYLGALVLIFLAGCTTFGENSASSSSVPVPEPVAEGEYLIGPGDALQIFVWRHPDLSTGVQVRPDGKISTPLVEDMRASGKTPTELARDLEAVLGELVRSPTVTVIVQSFVGEAQQQVRIVGQAQKPQAMQYKQGMTLLDVMIAVGGLSESASGNRAKIVRRIEGQQYEIPVRINDLLNKGKIEENVQMMPGDVLIIPESIF